MSGSGRTAFASSSNDSDVDRQLAAAGGHHRALDPDPVAAVEVVELVDGGPRRSSSVLTNSWIVPSRSWSVAKLSLPWRRSSRSRPAIRTRTSVDVAGGEVAVLGAERAGGRGRVEPDRVRLDAGGPHRVELGEPLFTEISDVLGRVLVDIVAGAGRWLGSVAPEPLACPGGMAPVAGLRSAPSATEDSSWGASDIGSRLSARPTEHLDHSEGSHGQTRRQGRTHHGRRQRHGRGGRRALRRRRARASWSPT